ncbi:unnamed protein product [Caenorhabditis auriculariae]|uniref:Uncharacterized protein n=1 Tax=Caenorhabditis auriculariae TaxID=2777116 RepID=A0A8S1HV02_9PELO|nr:unnamed protein product [Caenorhabditis auriculariae]
MDRSSGLVLVSSTPPSGATRQHASGGSNETHQLMAITQAGVWEVGAHRILYDVPNSVEAMTICKFKPTPNLASFHHSGLVLGLRQAGK